MRTIANSYYYASVGDNAVIVVDSFERAKQMRTYLRGEKIIRKFDSFDEASDYALDHLAEFAPWGCPIPERCVLNRMVTISKLERDAE